MASRTAMVIRIPLLSMSFFPPGLESQLMRDDGGERRARDEADQLASIDGDADPGRLRADERDDAVQRRGRDIGHVARDLNAFVVELQAEDAQGPQSAAAFAQGPRDRTRQADIARSQIHVERDQEIARSDGDRTGAGMDRDVADVGLPAATAPFDEPFKLTGADVGEDPALLVGCGGAVEDRRDAHGFPNALRRLARHRDRVGHRRGVERDAGQDVERAHARGWAEVRAQIDLRRRHLGERDRSVDDGCAIAEEGEDATVVDRITLTIGEFRAGAFDRRNAGAQDRFVASFRDVRHALEELHQLKTEPIAAFTSGATMTPSSFASREPPGGATIVRKPNLRASAMRRERCATPRTSPDNPNSPKAAVAAGKARPRNADAIASAIPRSAAGSLMRSPPATE